MKTHLTPTLLGAFLALATLVTWSTIASSPARAQDSGNGRQAPDKIEAGQTCMDCHQEVAATKRVHKPVRDEDCGLCHIQQAANRHIFLAPDKPGAVCQECHKLPERLGLHDPVAKGECLTCHKPHGSDQRYNLRNEDQKALCVECHKPQAGSEAPFVHGPVAAGACTLCHQPHSSRNKKLLREPVQDTCLGCHFDMADRMSAGVSVHKPVAEDCTQCHDPHASDVHFQLKAQPKMLCLDCHKEMLDKSTGGPDHYHGALNTNESCMGCHDVHASALPKLLKSDVRSLCLNCHDQPMKKADGVQLMGMAKKLTESKFLHGPVREGNCAACHNPHGSMTFDILRDPYPQRFYAPFDKEDYKLCFRCHDPNAFLIPLTKTDTGFRNGDQNLHFVHVNQEKGRTCRACHDTHGSDLPKHIVESVPFGNWDIPINFEMTPKGGSCAPGCHVRREYVNDGERPALNIPPDQRVNVWKKADEQADDQAEAPEEQAGDQAEEQE